MTKLGATMGKSGDDKIEGNFCLKENDSTENAMYFPQRGVDVLLEGQKVGTIGVLHPEVLEHF